MMQNVKKKRYVESVESNVFLGSDSLCDSNYDTKLNEVAVKFNEIKNDFDKIRLKIGLIAQKKSK